MSRIAGIISGSNNKSICLSMLRCVSALSDWKTYLETTGDCSLGNTGECAQSYTYSEGLIITLDGHIYDSGDISNEGSIGDQLRSSFHEIGFPATIQKLNGDFAVALYDSRDRSLWLARDRVGVKPLYYYAADSQYFAFASRPKSLLTLDFVDRTPNLAFVARFAGGHYRSFDNYPEQSPYCGIKQLPAAHILCINPSGERIFPYWTLEERPNSNQDINKLAEEYKSLIIDAVRKRVNSAPSPAFTLSGGMDSSTVLASSVKVLGKRQHAFSTVYLDKTYDESDEIRSMLDVNVEQWHAIQLDNDPPLLELLKEMISVNDEPVATATWLSHYILCKEVHAQGFKSLFGGLGGDELNAGEYEYFFFHFADLIAAGNNQQFEHEVGFWVKYHDHPVFKKSMQVALDSVSRMVDLARPGITLPDRSRMTRYYEAVNKDYYDLSQFSPNMPCPFSSYLKNRTYQDIFFETAPCCLRAEDRHTNAFGIGNFVPFFDYRLIEFMFSITGDMKIKDGVTKVLLRQAMKGILPDDTRNRIKKTGWNAPAHKWFSGKGLEIIRDMLGSAKFRQRGIYNITEVERVLDEHEKVVSSGEARENHMMFIWQMLNLELWHQSLEQKI